MIENDYILAVLRGAVEMFGPLWDPAHSLFMVIAVVLAMMALLMPMPLALAMAMQTQLIVMQSILVNFLVIILVMNLL